MQKTRIVVIRMKEIIYDSHIHRNRNTFNHSACICPKTENGKTE